MLQSLNFIQKDFTVILHGFNTNFTLYHYTYNKGDRPSIELGSVPKYFDNLDRTGKP